MIFTDADGKPIPRPIRDEFPSDVAFARAFHHWKDIVTNEANRAFDQALRALI